MMCAEPGMMPMRKPSTVPRAIGMAGLAPLLAVRPELAQLRADHLAGDLVARRRQDLAEPEQPDRDRHDADAVAELGDVERVAEVTAHQVDADGAEQQPERRHQQRAGERGGRHVGEEDEAEHQQRGVFGRAEAQRESWRAAARPGSARSRRRCRRCTSRPPRCRAPRRRGPCAPWRCRRCRSSPRRLRPGCAAGSRWSSRHIASRNRCRRASRSPWWRRARR